MKKLALIGIIWGIFFNNSLSASIWFADESARLLLASPTSQITVPASTMVFAEQSIVKKKNLGAFVSSVETYATASQDLLYSTSDAVVAESIFLTTTIDDVYARINAMQPGLIEAKVTSLATALTNTYSYLDSRITTTVTILDNRITNTMNQVYGVIAGLDITGLQTRVSALETELTWTYTKLDTRITSTVNIVDQRITDTMNGAYVHLDSMGLTPIVARVSALETNLTLTYNTLDNRITSTVNIVDTRISNTMDNVHLRIDNLGIPGINTRIGTLENNLTYTYNFLDNRITSTVNIVDNRITTTVDGAYAHIDSLGVPALQARVNTLDSNLTSTYNFLDARITTTVNIVDNRITVTVDGVYARLDTMGLTPIVARVSALETNLTSTYYTLDGRITSTVNIVDTRITNTMNDVHHRIDMLDASDLTGRVSALETNLTLTYNTLDNRITSTVNIVDTRISNTMDNVHLRIDNLGIPGINTRMDELETNLTLTYNFLDDRITSTVNIVDIRITNTMDNVHLRIDDLGIPGINTRIGILENNLTLTYNFLDDRITSTVNIVDTRITNTMDDVHLRIDDLGIPGINTRLGLLETNLTLTYNYLDGRITTTIGIVDNRITLTMNDAHARLSAIDVSSLQPRVNALETNLTNTYNYLGSRITNNYTILDTRITNTLNDADIRLASIMPAPVTARLDMLEPQLTTTYNYLNDLIAPTDIAAAEALAAAQKAEAAANAAQGAVDQDIFRNLQDDVSELYENASGEIDLDAKIGCLISVDTDEHKPLRIRMANGSILCFASSAVVFKPTDTIVVSGQNNVIDVVGNVDFNGRLILEENAKLIVTAQERSASAKISFAPNSALILGRGAVIERVENCAVEIDSACLIDAESIILPAMEPTQIYAK